MEKRKAEAMQTKRVVTSSMLGVFTAVEMGTLLCARAYDFPSWLITLCCVCIAFNVPLIVLALRAYYSQKRREEDRERQYRERQQRLNGRGWV